MKKVVSWKEKPWSHDSLWENPATFLGGSHLGLRDGAFLPPLLPGYGPWNARGSDLTWCQWTHLIHRKLALWACQGEDPLYAPEPAQGMPPKSDKNPGSFGRPAPKRQKGSLIVTETGLDHPAEEPSGTWRSWKSGDLFYTDGFRDHSPQVWVQNINRGDNL